jgi:hemoglobin
MDTKRDIASRDDIQLLMERFYERVKRDETIGIIFTEIVPLDWQHHIPLIVDFWETILLDHPLYRQNAMEKHFAINRIYPLKKEHFDAWLFLFNTTLAENFSGPVAELAKKRAASIAGLMQLKMNASNNTTLL